MTLAELLPAARKLTVTEKVKLIRILAEDLDTLEDIQTPEILKNQNPSKAVTTKSKTQRPFGLCAGEFVVPEDFDAPLPEEILNAFEGKWKSYWIHIFFCGLSVEINDYQ